MSQARYRAARMAGGSESLGEDWTQLVGKALEIANAEQRMHSLDFTGAAEIPRVRWNRSPEICSPDSVPVRVNLLLTAEAELAQLKIQIAQHERTIEFQRDLIDSLRYGGLP